MLENSYQINGWIFKIERRVTDNYGGETGHYSIINSYGNIVDEKDFESYDEIREYAEKHDSTDKWHPKH